MVDPHTSNQTEIEYPQVDGYLAYMRYLSLRNHFLYESYNYFITSRLVKVDFLHYKTLGSRWIFEKIAKDMKTLDGVTEFFLANILKNVKYWAPNGYKEENKIIYREWKGRIEARDHHFREDLRSMNRVVQAGKPFADLWKYEDGKHPIVFRMYIAEQIRPETLAGLTVIPAFKQRMQEWIDTAEDDYLIRNSMRHLMNYAPFLTDYSLKFVTTRVDAEIA